MNKEELVEIIAAEHNIPNIKASAILRTLLSTIQKAVIDGHKVTLVGFGSFEAVASKSRVGHNPRTGQTFAIKAQRRPKFTAGSTFKNAVSESAMLPD